jgi:hypothetical protein
VVGNLYARFINFEPKRAINFKISESVLRNSLTEQIQLILFKIMASNGTFNNISAISWRSVLLVGKTGEKYRPTASHCKTLSHSVVSDASRHEQNSNSQL